MIPGQLYAHHTFQKAVKDTVKKDAVVTGSAYSVFNKATTSCRPETRKKSCS